MRPIDADRLTFVVKKIFGCSEYVAAMLEIIDAMPTVDKPSIRQEAEQEAEHKVIMEIAVRYDDKRIREIIAGLARNMRIKPDRLARR